MRDIGFRAWDTEKKEMWIPDFIDHGGIPYKSIPYEPPCEYYYNEVMQYTGLKDKNGIKIFEGDILRCWHPEMFDDENDAGVYEVKYLIENQYPAFELNKFDGDGYNGLQYYIIEGVCEVIGNIYENPELLEK
jgi:uncharacterized phage protein (TIGR01671 family)